MARKYKEVAWPDGPEMRANGCVYEHRKVASQMLGRPLLPEEVVHHIDNDPNNNLPSNLMVFASKGDHTRYHCGGVPVLTENGAYISVRPGYANGKRLCLQCGAPTEGKLCFSCSVVARRKVERPSRDELARLLASESAERIGRRYGVSGKAVAKWADAYELAHNRQWQKRAVAES